MTRWALAGLRWVFWTPTRFRIAVTVLACLVVAAVMLGARSVSQATRAANARTVAEQAGSLGVATLPDDPDAVPVNSDSRALAARFVNLYLNVPAAGAAREMWLQQLGTVATADLIEATMTEVMRGPATTGHTIGRPTSVASGAVDSATYAVVSTAGRFTVTATITGSGYVVSGVVAPR